MGYKTFEIVFKQPSTDTGTVTINNASIENHFYKLQLNPDKGTIQSLYDKELNCELVDSSSPWELGAFIYNYNRTGLSECRIIDSSNGPIYQRILLQGKSPGTDEAFGVNLEIKLYHDTKRIELEYAIKRLPETEPQGYTLHFPSNCPKGNWHSTFRAEQLYLARINWKGHLQTGILFKTLYRYKIIGRKLL